MNPGGPPDISRRCRGLAPRLLFLFLLGGPLWTLTALATDEPSRIDIGPGSLQQALVQLADLTQLQILYDPALVRGLATHGVSGTKTPSEALKELLASTGITFEFTGDDAVALRAAAHGNSAGARNYTGPSRPQTVTINADRTADGSYSSRATAAGMKVDAPSLIAPVNTQSLTQQVLRDQQVNRLEDMLEYVSGTEIVPDGQSALGFAMRGFPTYQYYLDSVRTSPDLHHDAARDLANIDHAEIVKGPASLIFGRTEPGGLVNLVTKQPLAVPMLSLEQQVGSFDRRRTQLDAGGPLTSQGSLLYRFNAAWERVDSFRQVPDSRRLFLSPVVTWKYSQVTEETAYLEYLDSHDPSDSGLPVIGNRLPPVPINLSLDEGGEVHTTDLRLGVRGTHSFADGWKIRHHVEARLLRAPQSPQIALAEDGVDPGACSADSCPLQRSLVTIPDARGDTAYASADLARDFSLWRTRHSLLVGLDFFRSEERDNSVVLSDPGFATDLFNPRNVAMPSNALQFRGSQVTSRELWGGAYVQYQLSLADRLYLLSGWRYDYVSETGRSLHGVKQREGILWHPATPLSLYVSYTENFGANPGLYVNSNVGQLLAPPQPAHEWEVGLKWEDPDDRAAATAAWFDLTKTNVTLPLLEPALNQAGLLFLTGRARTRGLEVDLRAAIVPNLRLTASYAYIQSRIVNDTYTLGFPRTTNGSELIANTDNHLFGVPHHGGSAWGTYRFSGGWLGGLKVGAGAVVRGVREGDNINDYQLPGFARFNAMAAYGWHAAGTRMSVQLNIDNLLDKRYYESLSGTRTVMPGYPRRWIASYRVEF